MFRISYNRDAKVIFIPKWLYKSVDRLQHAPFDISYQQQLLQPPHFSFCDVFLFSQIFHLVDFQFPHQYYLLIVIINIIFIQNVMHIQMQYIIIIIFVFTKTIISYVFLKNSVLNSLWRYFCFSFDQRLTFLWQFWKFMEKTNNNSNNNKHQENC